MADRSIKKDISTWAALLKQKLTGKYPGEEETAIEEEGQNYDEMEDEKESLGKIRMTDGQRDTTMGINKKVVNLTIMGIVLVIVMAFFYKTSSNNEVEQQQAGQNQQKQEQSADSRTIHAKDGSLDYKDPRLAKLAQAEKAANSGKAQKPGGENPSQQAVVNRQAVQQPVPAIPQNQPTYSVPYSLPSAPVVQAKPVTVATTSEENREEQERKRSIEDRFKSAIAFALGKTDSTEERGGNGSSVGSNTQVDNSGFSYIAPSNNVLQAGSIIPVMLFSGINTDSDGQVTAQVQADVYDTATGSTLLIPAGSRIVGQYGAGANESGRVNVTFSRIILPDGGSYSIGDSMVAVDGQGYNGIQGVLHRHTGQKIRRGIMNSLFTALSTISVDRVTLGTDTFNNLTSDTVKPTITVEPGCEFNVYVTKPIAFSY